MNYVPMLIIALHFLLPVNACPQDFKFTVRPIHVHEGESISFVCYVNTTAAITVKSSENNTVYCGIANQRLKTGYFANENIVNCSTDGGMRSLTATVNATTEMEKLNFTCVARIYEGPSSIGACVSNSIKINVAEVPKLYLMPENMTFNDTRVKKIFCFTNSSNPVNVTLCVRYSATFTTMNSSLNTVEMELTASRELHNAQVHCEVRGVQRIIPKTTTIRVNYIFAKKSIVAYYEANGSQTFDCAKFIESYPGAQYEWLVNSTLTKENQSSFTCEATQCCNTSVTCVAKNTVTYLRSNVTFVYQKNQAEFNIFVNKSTTKENEGQDGIESSVVIATCTGGAIVIASIVAVLVWKRCFCRRSVDKTSRLLCCKQKDEVIDMTDNALYEAVPMVAAAATSVRPEECLVVASSTVVGNLKHKVKSDAYLVLFSDQSSTLGDIQEKIEETVPTRNSVKNVAFLLRRANTRLVLSLSDNVHIDGNSIASDRKLRDFLKQVVERYMDTSSDELRLDLLNYPDLGTSKEEKVAKRLATLLGMPVFLSHDMYGVTTDVDDKRCVADVYFNRRHIENPVIYAEVDLSKDSRRFPTDTQEKVVYSEVVRPARRPYLSTGQ